MGWYRIIGIDRSSNGGGAASFKKHDQAEISGEGFKESGGEWCMEDIWRSEASTSSGTE